MSIAIDQIDTPHSNPCSIPVPPEADAALLRTVQTHGVLSAILVRPAGNRFELVFGFRRLAAARAAGLTEIAATIRSMTDPEVLEAQVIENQHRRQMHPVDQWRAAADMLAAGVKLADAAIALGYPEREARRMERLADLHPDVRARVIHSMPRMEYLKIIAAAPQARQQLALKAQYAVEGEMTNWNVVANACRDATIPRGRAIFDLKTAGVVFQEDLFAEPGADDQFVTDNVDGFLAAQHAALAKRVATGKRKNERIVLLGYARGTLTLPRGYTRRFDSKPARTPKGATGPTLFVAVSGNPAELGKVIEILADPPAPLAPQSAGTSRTPDGASYNPRAAALHVPGAPERHADLDDALEIELAPITNRGRQIIAATKTVALREILRGLGPNQSVELLAACLVVALAGKNVRIEDETRYSMVNFDDLVPRLVDPAGQFQVQDAPIDEILAETLARILIVTDPVSGQGSGPAPEWIGNVLDANEALPRFDTPEFLATLARRELLEVAATTDIAVPDKVGALREVLAGRAPGYRPTTFGAPGPQPPANARPVPAEEAAQ